MKSERNCPKGSTHSADVRVVGGRLLRMSAVPQLRPVHWSSGSGAMQKLLALSNSALSLFNPHFRPGPPNLSFRLPQPICGLLLYLFLVAVCLPSCREDVVTVIGKQAFDWSSRASALLWSSKGVMRRHLCFEHHHTQGCFWDVSKLCGEWER